MKLRIRFVVPLVVTLIAAALTFGPRLLWGTRSSAKACINNLWMIEAAQRQWEIEHSETNDLAAGALFQDTFKGKLADGWAWVREHREAWRTNDAGLEVLVEAGNMWGPQNNARNVLVRPLPALQGEAVEVAVTVENRPSNPYEQVDLVWYFDDSNMVKLGQQLVDGNLRLVMGREEQDRCRTIGNKPLESDSVRLKLTVSDNEILGQFRPSGKKEWRYAGRCALPASNNVPPQVSLQFYQGSENAEHWARVTDFTVRQDR